MPRTYSEICSYLLSVDDINMCLACQRQWKFKLGLAGQTNTQVEECAEGCDEEGKCHGHAQSSSNWEAEQSYFKAVLSLLCWAPAPGQCVSLGSAGTFLFSCFHSPISILNHCSHCDQSYHYKTWNRSCF